MAVGVCKLCGFRILGVLVIIFFHDHLLGDNRSCVTCGKRAQIRYVAEASLLPEQVSWQLPSNVDFRIWVGSI